MENKKTKKMKVSKKRKSQKKIFPTIFFYFSFCHRKTRRKTGIPVSGHLPDRTDRGQPPKPPDGPDIVSTAPKKDRASRK